MTVARLAMELGLWDSIKARILEFAPDRSASLLEQLAVLPVRRSRATRSLGAYVSREGVPVCIRLQFAQESENLKQTLLHEIAHACDHLISQPGRHYRKAHGPAWQLWARALGTTADRRGNSEALRRLHQQRLKPVAVCRRCGAELLRVRRLNRRRSYLHVNCGGQLQLL